MMPPDNMTCHETGHTKLCKDLCMNCWKWMQIVGNDPNTGQPVNEWRCADAWLPMLLIENSQQQRQTGAAVESFRNEMVRQNEENTVHLQTMIDVDAIRKQIAKTGA